MDQFATAFITLWVLLAIPSVIVTWRGIRKAQRMFPATAVQSVRFRERGASGYSKKSLLTRVGGANRVLEVVVTESEVWVKGIFAVFTFIGSCYDLSHRIRRENLLTAHKAGRQVELRFVAENGATTELVLVLNDPDRFLAALER